MTTTTIPANPPARWLFAGYGGPINDYCWMPAKMVNPAEPEAWYWARCGSARKSRCEPCAKIKRGDIASVGRSGWVDRPTDRGYFVTLTAPGADQLPWDTDQCLHGAGVACSGSIGCKSDALALSMWHAGIGQRWSWFMTEVRRLLGVDVQFFKTWEVQRRGALHLHSMMRADGVVTDRRMRAAIKLAARRWGFGKQVDIQVVDLADGLATARTAGYCAKYASKSADDLLDVTRLNFTTGEVRPVGLRSWSASRRWGETMAAIKLRRCQYAASVAGSPTCASMSARAAAGGALDLNQGIYATGTAVPVCGVDSDAGPL